MDKVDRILYPTSLSPWPPLCRATIALVALRRPAPRGAALGRAAPGRTAPGRRRVAALGTAEVFGTGAAAPVALAGPGTVLFLGGNY